MPARTKHTGTSDRARLLIASPGHESGHARVLQMLYARCWLRHGTKINMCKTRAALKVQPTWRRVLAHDDEAEGVLAETWAVRAAAAHLRQSEKRTKARPNNAHPSWPTAVMWPRMHVLAIRHVLPAGRTGNHVIQKAVRWRRCREAVG